ncbi:hypothetical protein Tcan_15609 [Toxocara canis]|uniref:Uncharacterized protein n=1 Tax=Toxocara canis TaxID=6265 RepID=A0A0B2VHF3_TOXCA|nr:hypothetical protein Tcan_15609 [Toxocara canis]
MCEKISTSDAECIASPSSRLSDAFLQQDGASDTILEDNAFEQFFGAFINHSPKPSTWQNSYSALADDTKDDDQFNILNVGNGNVSQNEFDITMPHSIPQGQLEAVFPNENAIQYHQRLVREQIQRNEQIATFLSPWRKRQEQMQKRKTKRCGIVRRKFSLAAGLDTASNKRLTGKRNSNSAQGSLKRRDRPPPMRCELFNG